MAFERVVTCCRGDELVEGVDVVDDDDDVDVDDH